MRLFSFLLKEKDIRTENQAILIEVMAQQCTITALGNMRLQLQRDYQ